MSQAQEIIEDFQRIFKAIEGATEALAGVSAQVWDLAEELEVDHLLDSGPR